VLGDNPVATILFTAPETVGGVNGPFHSTVTVNGLRFADIYEVDDAYVIERNGLQTDPVTREMAMRMLRTTANSYLVFAAQQFEAEAEAEYLSAQRQRWQDMGF
jgi:hypothetical protein